MATPLIFTPSPGEAIEPEIRTDLGTFVLFVNNEGDILDFILGGRTIHKPADSRSFRLGEIVGTSHFDRYQLEVLRPDLAKSDTLDCRLPRERAMVRP